MIKNMGWTKPFHLNPKRQYVTKKGSVDHPEKHLKKAKKDFNNYGVKRL